MVKLRNFQSVVLATSGLFLAASPAARAADAAIGGVVRDSSGMPQMDVLVQLMRADSSVIKTVRTDARGRYLIAGVMPGIYQLKAVETSFLPTLRENLRVGTRGRTEANLTLSTLLEALQWLPAHKRTSTEPEDDWTWTLRSAAYRPLLRFVGEDGIETIETRESRAHAQHGRLILQSGTRAFGEGGPSETAEFSHQDFSGTQTLLRAKISDTPGASTQLVAGLSKENAEGAGLSSVLAYQVNPGVYGGMRVLRLRTADTLRLTPELTAVIGNQMQLLGVGAANTTSIAPFADISWTHDAMTASYVVSTSPRLRDIADLADEHSLLPLAEMRNGVLGTEHGLHQELKLERANESMSASVAVYQDNVRNPIIDGTGRLGELAAVDSLFDAASGIARVTGEDYEARGVVVEVSHNGPASTRASLQYASGSALTPTADKGTSPSFKSEQAQAIALMLNGVSAHTGTTWRASYRWQPGSTVNAVDLFDTGMADAYLSLFLRQSLHLGHVVPGGVDAIVDVRNLLAQGYHPFLTTDGGTLFFAQVNRSVQGGLTFYF